MGAELVGVPIARRSRVAFDLSELVTSWAMEPLRMGPGYWSAWLWSPAQCLTASPVSSVGEELGLGHHGAK